MQRCQGGVGILNQKKLVLNVLLLSFYSAIVSRRTPFTFIGKPHLKLTDKEREILTCVQHRADRPVAELAKLTNLREHSVRYSLHRLIEDGIISRRAYIDIYRIGYSKHAFFFSLSVSKAQARKDILAYLLKHPRIAYLAEVGGDFRFKVDICTRNQVELHHFLTEFADRFGNILREKAFVQLLEQIEFSVKCISTKTFPILSLRMGTYESAESVDMIDHQILVLLSEINERSFSELARTLNMSLSSLQYRIEALQKKKVLLGFRYVVNGALFGLHDYFHLLYVKGMRSNIKRKLLNFCTKHRDIRYFVPCIGAWDFEVGSNVESPEHAAEIADELYEIGGEAMLRVETLPLFRYMKVSNYPFVEPQN